jgi:hypothetical protein
LDVAGWPGWGNGFGAGGGVWPAVVCDKAGVTASPINSAAAANARSGNLPFITPVL